ncbi:MAG: pantoate--beta-alanine ligase [Betaproteobacteria bacterium]|nr:pantoate--beta-alanine ligase [Betaproteobacteria bacterium]
MDIIHTVAELRARLARETTVGFVPTMGNLHQGHIDIAHVARERASCLVVSIFVNRLQFGVNEDFDKYPRTLKDDCEYCRSAGVDVVFAPSESEMYPTPQHYIVEPPGIQHILEGAVRPGHFRGVSTVVLKLFNMVQPQIAVFGKKDYQQCRVLTSMVQELNLPVELLLAETVRAGDGLALSSRNSYLTTTERQEAPQLFSALSRLKAQLLAGNSELLALEAEAMAHLAARGWQPDYITVRRQSDLLPPEPHDRALVILGAARLGIPRLIDNIEVELPENMGR